MKTRTFRIGPKPLDKQRATAWLDAQINYENLAGDEEVALAARNFVVDKVRRFESKMAPTYDKWETIDFMLRGATLSTLLPGSDVHVPVLYAMVESIVPRIVEAITSLRPWFEVEGRDKQDKQRARKIQAWLRYQVDQTGLERKLEEMARTMVVYQSVIVKDCWDVRHREQVVRDIERSVGTNGLPTFKVTPKLEEVQVYEGNRFDLINPFHFVCDTSKTCPQEMAFVGDSTMMREDDLRRMVEMGTFDANAVDQLIEAGSKRAGYGGLLSNFGSIGQTHGQQIVEEVLAGLDFRAAHKRSEPGEFRVYEIWATWRPETDDSKAPFKEWVITVCGDQVLRVQENFYDDKRRPYSVGRAAKEPFEFYNVGVLDHAVRLNEEIDDHRNLARLSHRLSLTPYGQVSENSDWPANLMDVDPGQLFRGQEPPSWIKVPSTLGELIPFEQMLRVDMEKATGAPEIFQGEGQNNTATEVERKTQEGNRRMRRMVHSFADMLESLLRHFHQNTQQFLTYQRPFQVLGAQGAGMLDYELSPDDLGDPVDIIISGPERLASYGLRATQMSTWMQQYGVLIPALQAENAINLPLLAKIGWERIMGEELGEEVIHVPERSDEMLSPQDENLILLMGQSVETHEGDDDAEHDQLHAAAQKYAEANEDQEAVRRIVQHRQMHRIQQRQKTARQQAAMNPTPGPFPSRGDIATRHAPAEGRGYQPTPDIAGGVTQTTPPRETPGPARPQSTGSPDRSPAAPQTANR